MDDRKEYWWVRHEAVIQPAEVGFVGGIPISFRFIGMAGSIPAASAELIERLPSPPIPVIGPQTEPSPQPQAPPALTFPQPLQPPLPGNVLPGTTPPKKPGGGGA